MDKLMEEEDLKGLEEEIDNAVDRLFVERKRDREETFFMESSRVEPHSKPSALEPSMTPPVLDIPTKADSFKPSIQSPISDPFLVDASFGEVHSKPSTSKPSSTPPVFEAQTKPQESSIPSPISDPSVMPSAVEPSVDSFILEPSFEFEKDLDMEKRPDELPAPPAPAPPIPFLKSIERMEAQLLSLEWEITEEKLEKTREEILALKELLKHKTEMTLILGRMENVVSRMIKNQEDIRPPWVKFLLDSKETIKLLMRKETGGDISIYKQLAYLGIEARFSCLEGLQDTQILPASFKAAEFQASGLSIFGEKKIGEMSESVHGFMKRVEDIFGTIQQQIFKLEETNRRVPPASAEARSPSTPAVHVTIFKIDERLFGVESEKVFKLFRVPNSFELLDQQRIRLRDLEVKMVDLKKLLAIEEGGPKEQIRILTVKENGEYKGWMVDEVLRRVSTSSERSEGAGGYFSGVIHFTYHERAVEIPILDLTKF